MNSAKISTKSFTVIDLPNFPLSVILSDFKYWAEHESELDSWLDQFNDAETRRGGAVVYFGSAKFLTAFLLRWQ